MKVLIVSAYFPPGNAIGSVRLGKLARHLIENGCDVRVICALDETLPQTLAVEIPGEHVTATKWLDLHWLPRLIMSWISKNPGGPKVGGARLSGVVYDLFRSVFHWPDRHVGWYWPARRAGRNLIAEWKPDVIYASAWPITALRVGASLSKKFSIPWVAELRDLWLDNHYYRVPRWRRWIDHIIERKLLTSASLLVTVSEPLAEILKNKFGRPIAVTLNGFDPEDVVETVARQRDDVLTITYTGMIYPGRRDPRPLFEALQMMGPMARRVRVRFFGRTLPGLNALIESYGLHECVEVCAPIPYREALKAQAESDVLLLLMWDTLEERGVYTGKLFEYLGARRPILSLGLEQGVAADLIRDRGAGIVTNSAARVVEALTQWLRQKDLLGDIPTLAKSVGSGLSRTEQFDRLLPLIRSVASRPLQKPKVAFVTRKLDVGGSERHLLQILPPLAERFDVLVFVIHAEGELEHAFAQEGVKVVRPPLALGKVLGRVFAATRIAAFLARNRSAVVHFFLPEAYLIGGICGAVLWHSRMVMSRRSLNVYQREHPVATVIEKLLHKKMRIVVCNSNAVGTDLLDEGVSESRLRLIYNGVNIFPCSNDAEQNSQRSGLGIADDEFVIIAVANLIPYKGHEDLIRALASIAPEMPITWRLLLVGRDDGIQAALQELIDASGLSGRVIFAGQVDVVEPLWAIADIGVLPSHQEGFSNSILEGMAAGLPMVVSNVGGNAEAVLHEVTGFVVPPHCPRELGAAILSLAVNPAQCKSFGKAARQRAEKMFSLAACVKAYEDLYLSLHKKDQ